MCIRGDSTGLLGEDTGHNRSSITYSSMRDNCYKGHSA